MSEQQITVAFVGESRTANIPPGDSLLRAARDAGIDVTTTCGGRGRCRSCRVKLVKGTAPAPTLAELVQLGEEEINEGYRLCCQYVVSGDAAVQITPPLTESAFQILAATGRAGGDGRLALDCGVAKVHMRPTPPSDEDRPTSDLDELLRGAGHGEARPIGLNILRQVPALLRNSSDGLTVTTFGSLVMSLEPGDTTEDIYGIAFDIGTTTVVGYLIHLASGETLATVSGLNPQAVYGGDLISRIAFATEAPANVRRLRGRIVGFVNELIGEACAEARVQREHIYKAVVVGNTCMHHLFLGLDPTSVGRAPYAPVLRHAYCCAAREVGLRVHSDARLFLLPLVAGFVGADTVGMILSTRIYASSELRAAVDIGTNAEVVMGGRDGLMACSSPAGPALEGGQIRNGMRAAHGAVDRVRIDDDAHVHAIGEVPPLGICGSGLIDAAAALLDAGVVAASGRLLVSPERPLPDKLKPRIREDTGGTSEFVLVWARESGNGKDIVINQGDIRQLQLAKAAIKSGLKALEQVMGVTDREIAELLLAGGFGNYLNIRSARRIGMIPDLPTSKVRYVANAAGLGAQMALLSETERERAGALAQQITHVSLAGHPDFQRIFLDAIAFPATIEDERIDG